MTVYKNFLRIVGKQKTSVIMYSCIFLVVIMLTSSSSKTNVQEFKEISLDLIIIDKDNSDISKNLVQYLHKKNNVLPNLNLQDYNEEEILRVLKKEISLGNIDAGIIINKNLEEKLSSGVDCVTCIKDDRSQTSFYVERQIQKFLLFAETVKNSAGKFDFEKIHTALSENITVTKINSQKDSSTGYWFLRFFNMFAWFSFSIILNIIGFAMFLLKKPTIKIRNDVAPISIFKQTAETFLAEVTVILFILAIIIGGAIAFNIKTINNIPIFIYSFNAAIYSVVILGITFMLNSLLKNGSVLGILGTILPLALSFTSGVFVPVEFISPKIVRVAKLFPTYYFVKANEFTFLHSTVNWFYVGVLFQFFILYFLIGLYFTKLNRSKKKIDKEQQ